MIITFGLSPIIGTSTANYRSVINQPKRGTYDCKRIIGNGGAGLI
jgi:hypothetical protein